MLIAPNMWHQLPHLAQDILRQKTQLIIRDLQQERVMCLALILEVVSNFIFHSLIFLDLLIDGKVDLTNISWYMPQVQMAPEYLTGMRNMIEQKVTIPLGFRARTSEQTTLGQTHNFTWRLSVTGGVEKARWIIFGFQTNRINTQ